MPERIYLTETQPRTSPSGVVQGHVVGCTAPLQPVMAKRWAEGDLRRVTEDGAPWPGGGGFPGSGEPAPAAVPAPAAYPEPVAFADSADDPARPRGNASQDAWASYAVALGALTEDEASGMTRDELVAAVPAAG